MTRTADKILNRATKIIANREKYYATPEDNFKNIARFWSIYLQLEKPLTPADVAWMMVLLKIARAINSPDHEDTIVDAAAYAALAGEVVRK